MGVSKREFAIAAVLAAVLLGLVVWRMSVVMPPRRDFGACRSRVALIADLLRSYQRQHKALPPAATTRDKRGACTWRIMILPTDPPSIASQYRYDEPWNGPHNSALYDPNYDEWYHCPSDPGPRHETSYVAVIGPNTAFRGDQGVNVPERGHGENNTILIVETQRSGIHWMEPRDLSIKDALRGIHAKPGPSISGAHFEEGADAGAHVAFADGSVRWLKSDLDPKVLEQMLEIPTEKSAKN